MNHSVPASSGRTASVVLLGLLAVLCWFAWWSEGLLGGRTLLTPETLCRALPAQDGTAECSLPAVALRPLDTLRLTVTAPGGMPYGVAWELPFMGLTEQDTYPPESGTTAGQPVRAAFLLECQICMGDVVPRIIVPNAPPEGAVFTCVLERQSGLSLLAEACRVAFPLLAAALALAALRPRLFAAPVLLALGCFALYTLVASAPGGAQAGDNRWYLPTAKALLHGSTDLKGYPLRQAMISAPSLRTTADGRVVNYYPPGLSLALVPLAAWSEHLNAPEALVADTAAKVLAAGSVGVLCSIALELGLGAGLSIAAALAFALCTSQFSVHAGGLWSHNLSCLLFLLMTRLMLHPDRPHPWALALLGAGALLCRHDAAFMLLGAGGVMAFSGWRPLARYGLCLALCAVGAALLSHALYGTVLPPYMTEQGPQGSLTDAPGTLLGLLFSPNRGLLVFNPVFAAGLCYALWRLPRPRVAPVAGWGLSLAALCFLGALCFFPMWWGGWSYGPRLFGGFFGLLAVLALLGLVEIARQGAPRMLLVPLLAAMLLWGGFVHLKGAVVGDSWNGTPVDVNTAPARLWDWRDMQILRGQDIFRAVLESGLRKLSGR